jgi:quercetin dioxygenase-like cupin family protein
MNNLRSEGVRPYVWENGPNFRYAPHSHGYDTILYCVEGSLQVIFEEVDQIIDLGTGDRLDIPAGIRHAIIIGPSGARCLEADHR